MSTDSSDAAISRLSLYTSVQGDATVVRCCGRLTAGLTDVLHGEVKRLMPHTKRIVLDLTELAKLDSLGLGTIVGLYVSAKASGCELKLINLSQQIQTLFRVTKLASLFEVYGNNPVKLP